MQQRELLELYRAMSPAQRMRLRAYAYWLRWRKPFIAAISAVTLGCLVCEPLHLAIMISVLSYVYVWGILLFVR